MVIGPGGNSESGRISQIIDRARNCAISEGLQRVNQLCCPPLRVGASNRNVLTEGAYLTGKEAICITNASSTGPILINNTGQIVGSNAYLNVGGIPESSRISRLQAATTDAGPRFSEYIRFEPLAPPLPLPALATNAGNPVPSTNSPCLGKNVTLV